MHPNDMSLAGQAAVVTVAGAGIGAVSSARRRQALRVSHWSDTGSPLAVWQSSDRRTASHHDSVSRNPGFSSLVGPRRRYCELTRCRT